MIGFLNVYKPQEMSSAAVVGKIKKQFNLKKVGHMGTLDPLACGVLPIAIGKATRMFDYVLNKKKTYFVNAEFGYETSSLDLGTEKTQETSTIPNLESIKKGCINLVGVLNQMPPKYSAKKVNGEKAYNLIRSGVEFDLKPSKIEIYNFECVEQINKTTFKFKIECSGGTYVRSLIRDLAYNLNSLATVTFLERTQSGYFLKENAIELNTLLSNDNLENLLINIPTVFNEIENLEVSDEDFIKLKNGLLINATNTCNFTFITNKNKVLGVAEQINGNLKLKTYLLDD